MGKLILPNFESHIKRPEFRSRTEKQMLAAWRLQGGQERGKGWREFVLIAREAGKQKRVWGKGQRKTEKAQLRSAVQNRGNPFSQYTAGNEYV